MFILKTLESYVTERGVEGLVGWGAILSGTLAMSSLNPIYSILGLICAFLNGSALLVAGGKGFLGLTYIIVYVGAIAVLFLFAIMLLDIKKESYSKEMDGLQGLWLNILFSVVLGYSFSVALSPSSVSLWAWFEKEQAFNSGPKTPLSEGPAVTECLVKCFEETSSIRNLGEFFYGGSGESLIILGLLLVVALMGALELSHLATPEEGRVETGQHLSILSAKPLYLVGSEKAATLETKEKSYFKAFSAGGGGALYGQKTSTSDLTTSSLETLERPEAGKAWISALHSSEGSRGGWFAGWEVVQKETFPGFMQGVAFGNMAVLALFFSALLLGLSYIISRRAWDGEKVSPYECGFLPSQDARSRFDIRYYKVCLLFILFDLEILLLMPLVSLDWGQIMEGWGWVFPFLWLLILGVILETTKGGLARL